MTMSRARSRSMPLCLRRSWYAAANRPRSSGSVGLSSASGREVDAEQAGPLLDLAGLAEDRQVGDPAAQQGVGGLEDPVVVALGQHDVAPVADGLVDELVLEHQRGHRARAGDLEPVEQQRHGRRAPRTARARWPPCGASPSGAGRAPTSAPASRRWCRASWRRSAWWCRGRRSAGVTCSGSSKPPLSTIPAICGKFARHLGGEHAEHHLGPVAGRDDDRAVEEPVEHVRQRHRRDHDAGRLLRQQRLLTADQRAVARGHQVGHRRRAQQRLLGQRERRYAEPVERLDHRVEVASRSG